MRLRPILRPGIGTYIDIGSLEDGMPGTGKKIAGVAFFLLGGVAGGIVSIFAHPAAGGAVILGSLVIGMAFVGWGMYDNYQENRKMRELQKKNWERYGEFQDKGAQRYDKQSQEYDEYIKQLRELEILRLKQQLQPTLEELQQFSKKNNNLNNEKNHINNNVYNNLNNANKNNNLNNSKDDSVSA